MRRIHALSYLFIRWAQKNIGWDGIRTRASEEIRALTWRLRPLGHSTKNSHTHCGNRVCIFFVSHTRCKKNYAYSPNILVMRSFEISCVTVKFYPRQNDTDAKILAYKNSRRVAFIRQKIFDAYGSHQLDSNQRPRDYDHITVPRSTNWAIVRYLLA